MTSSAFVGTVAGRAKDVREADAAGSEDDQRNQRHPIVARIARKTAANEQRLRLGEHLRDDVFAEIRIAAPAA
jgi:hypothetical protein